MKTIHHILLGAVALTAPMLQSCSDSDSNLTPSEPEVNYFNVDPKATDPESELRRDFYNKTGIYLLFNDTLYSYFDEVGRQHFETIDFNWNLESYNTTNYQYTYLKDFESKKAVIEAFEKYFVPYINVPDGKMKPYSFTAFSTIKSVNSYGRVTNYSYINCWRSSGVAFDSWIGMDEEGMKSQAKNLLRGIVDSKLQYQSPELDEFYEVTTEDVYYSDPVDIIDGWEEYRDESKVYDLGFLRYYIWYDDDPSADYFPSMSTDVKLFKDAVFNEDETEFRKKWADYPKILLKYEIMKRIIEDMGVNFNI